ncbi:glutathione S-transferase [Coccomyxa subellipsoidea C-169]|uniref:Glutathione S-transferase n=1 Tax=Coccomyxa subellipsoidea (strain C-169) TaxID=574566 RepID=I0YZ34_COCSC|nr:glutathione S-transferase [Coccomyxa subellipsoidea C-169]EIE23653.1 glutathione S-transferase [Coccomyxa subellipsoidea C-169]|eukprot:XP_005648197.1 glutathione S-transferase [Coccomyxa subellipsoidea C-169]
MSCHLRWVLPSTVCPPLLLSRRSNLTQPLHERSSLRHSDRHSTLITRASIPSVPSMLGSLQSLLNQPGAKAGKQTTTFSDNAPSWEALQQLVEEKGRQLNWQQPDLENGPTNPLALKRTFGQPGTPRVKLYRDHAAWCPYCQKVWLQLEEKQIPYTLEKINMRCYGDKPPEYTAKVPSGLLPAMELDGQLIVESAEIMRILEEAFPDNKPLLPPKGSKERQRADSLMRLERRLFSDWLSWLTTSWQAPSSHTIPLPHCMLALRTTREFIATMDAVDRELGAAGGPFFLGADLSMVDVVFSPFLERIAASILYYKGLTVRGDGRWKNLERWFESMEARPAYIGTRSDFYTHVHDLPPQLGGCASVPDADEAAAAIDGVDGKSWQLPLPPLNATSFPEPYSPGEDPPLDRLRAAARLVGNHGAIAKFAARGCGKPGRRPVSAPLSDPTATAGENFLEAVDAGLRHVAHALLEGAHASSLRVGDGENLPGDAVVASAEYIRDRVGVPRDLPYPAARQLRAHLNWLIGSLTA